MLRPLAVVTVVGLFAGACSGSGGADTESRAVDDTSGGAGTDTAAALDGDVDVPPEIVAAAGAIEAQWGAEDGFAVILLSIDRGYSIDQILETPSLGSDGTIDGLVPDDGPLGLIEAAPDDGEAAEEGFGEIVLASVVSSLAPNGAYIEFLDETASEIFMMASRHLADQDAAAQAAIQTGALVLQLTLLLMSRGYNLDQVVEALFFGTFRIGNFPCVEIEDDPPVLSRGGDDLELRCGALPAGADDAEEVAEPEDTEPADSDTDGGSADPAGSDGARFVGTIDDNGGSTDTSAVIVNRVELVAGTHLVGTMELLLEDKLTEQSPQPDCFFAVFTLSGDSVPATDEGTYAGIVEAAGAFPAGACPPGGPPLDPESVTQGPISATITGDVITGVVGEGADAFTFTAHREG